MLWKTVRIALVILCSFSIVIISFIQEDRVLPILALIFKSVRYRAKVPLIYSVYYSYQQGERADDVYANQQRRNMGCGRCPGLGEADVSDGLPDFPYQDSWSEVRSPRIGSGQPLRIQDFVSG